MAAHGWRSVGKNIIYWEKGDGNGHAEHPATANQVADSIRSTFKMHDGYGEKYKLRSAQFGAYHAFRSYQTLKDTSPCTIVMPTGTGKTETMLAIFLQEPKKTLIIVPSDALRHQTMLKMISLGIIPKLNYFDGEYLKPVVGIIKSEIKNPLILILVQNLCRKALLNAIDYLIVVISSWQQSLLCQFKKNRFD